MNDHKGLNNSKNELNTESKQNIQIVIHSNECIQYLLLSNPLQIVISKAVNDLQKEAKNCKISAELSKDSTKKHKRES